MAQTKDPKIARRIADKLSVYKDPRHRCDYAMQLNAVQKKAGITGTAAKVARGLRPEAYQFMNSILESVNLTWQDIGYDVIILEEETDYVYPIAGLQRIRELVHNEILEISTLVTQILLESLILEAEGKNTYPEHLEDNIFNKGFEGAQEAVNYPHTVYPNARRHPKESVSMTTKWDGAPIVAGKDPETGKFCRNKRCIWPKRQR